MERWLNKIINGDCLVTLKQIPDQSIHCCVTSPPYWGLRDYGVPGQLGLEKTPEEYTAKMVEIFREVRRVLRDDGTLWLNLGDSYASDTKGSGGHNPKQDSNVGSWTGTIKLNHGIKPKDLVGIPWRVAFALQADGWYLRSDIIWHKPNPMPESVTDRPTKAHEYIFLMSKSERYYYDGESIKERATGLSMSFNGSKTIKSGANGDRNDGGRNKVGLVVQSINKRTVWTVPTHPYPEAHFATFPPDLIKPCIKAGCPEEGIVVDPFMGSGTTAEVCCNLNRQFIGIELNPEYCKLADARIARATAQTRLFYG